MCNLLDWNKRYKIILGVARVLVYLHNHAPIQIIHRDVKPSNILLDESFDPKLLDFGAAIAIYETDHIEVGQTLGT
uniref:non-specific serine/threonine protein kinase n=1 Tax=Helianthus annuus TaxID=4232 RepID=A0A251TN61_HELAN